VGFAIEKIDQQNLAARIVLGVNGDKSGGGHFGQAGHSFKNDSIFFTNFSNGCGRKRTSVPKSPKASPVIV